MARKRSQGQGKGQGNGNKTPRHAQKNGLRDGNHSAVGATGGTFQAQITVADGIPVGFQGQR
jgi:hypothetical protein